MKFSSTDFSDIDFSGDVDRLCELIKEDDTRFDSLKKSLVVLYDERKIADSLLYMAVNEGEEQRKEIIEELYEDMLHEEVLNKYWSESIQEAELRAGLSKTELSYSVLCKKHSEFLSGIKSDINSDSEEETLNFYIDNYAVMKNLVTQSIYKGVGTTYSGFIDEDLRLDTLMNIIDEIQKDESHHIEYGYSRIREFCDSLGFSRDYVNERVYLRSETVYDILSHIFGDKVGNSVNNTEMINWVLSEHDKLMNKNFNGN